MANYERKDLRKDIYESMKACDNVITRFPPEPSGCLHIGHGKALYMNAGLANYFNGKMLLRFDDTNPTNEDDDYELSILEDIKTLKIEPYSISYTSDYFHRLLEMCKNLVESGKAYADDTDPEIQKEERNAGIESKNRNNTVEKNLEMFKLMVDGNNVCIRLKIDMNHVNKCMRDPTLYRVNTTPHRRTGTQFKAYPTYDFACPIVDSIEGVTHALRSVEYSDREEMYKLILTNFSMRIPKVSTYGKVNFSDTVLSKRKIKKMIADKKVYGWNDPRLGTIKGVLNRGISVDALLQFLKSLGMSKNSTEMTWDKLYGINRKIIDKVSTRIQAIENVVELKLDRLYDSTYVPKFSKNKNLGNRIQYRNKVVYVEQEEFNECIDGEEVTFINWGNFIIDKSNMTARSTNGDVKSTKHKLVWVSASECCSMDIKSVQNDSIVCRRLTVENEVNNMNTGEYCQVFRKGYYIKKDLYLFEVKV